MVVRVTVSCGSCAPRWATSRRPERVSLGPAVGAAAAVLGVPLMGWQRQVADVGLELLDDGRPAYRDVIFSTPRQSGKTMLLLSWMLHRAIWWAAEQGPQRIAYSAQTGADARRKLLDDIFPMLERFRSDLGVRSLRRANGTEGVDWWGGSKLVLHASTEDAGHGQTLDLGVQDELFHDVDWRRDQSMGPAMITRPAAQRLRCSTAGTADSVVWNELVSRGRAAAESDAGVGVAYFEWSAAADADPADPATWWGCMPALGVTVSEDAIRAEFATMAVDEFRRAYLNVPSVVDARVIPASVWALAQDAGVEVTHPAMFGVDVNPERSAGAVVACDAAGGVVELADYRPGVEWLPARVVELAERYGLPVALDPAGPVASYGEELRRGGVRVVEVGGRDMVRACGVFADRLTAGVLRVRSHPAFDLAAAAAAKRSAGDAWAWARRSSRDDICPIVAATVAVWAVQASPALPDLAASVW